MARPEEIAAEEVVLPTPPLPDVITIILVNAEPFLFYDSTQYLIISVHGIDQIIQAVKAYYLIFFFRASLKCLFSSD